MLRKKLKLEKCTSVEQNQSNETSMEISTKRVSPFWKEFYEIECRLNEKLRGINFLKGQVAAVYNPVEYAAEIHCAYLEKFLTGPKSVLFIGMNPGPWGMVQTGVNNSQMNFSFNKFLL